MTTYTPGARVVYRAPGTTTDEPGTVTTVYPRLPAYDVLTDDDCIVRATDDTLTPLTEGTPIVATASPAHVSLSLSTDEVDALVTVLSYVGGSTVGRLRTDAVLLALTPFASPAVQAASRDDRYPGNPLPMRVGTSGLYFV